jgi:adenosylcobyric acid synthase
MADLAALRAEGWDIDLMAHVRRGGMVLGLCGGYQMLGQKIHDPHGLEGTAGSVDGLGLLAVETTLMADKTLTRVSGLHAASGLPISGYEIHLGQTAGPDCARPFARLGQATDGATSRSGQIIGSYLHGCFASDRFRSRFLQSLGIAASTVRYDHTIDATLDQLAQHMETHLDLDRILTLAKVL